MADVSSDFVDQAMLAELVAIDAEIKEEKAVQERKLTSPLWKTLSNKDGRRMVDTVLCMALAHGFTCESFAELLKLLVCKGVIGRNVLW